MLQHGSIMKTNVAILFAIILCSVGSLRAVAADTDEGRGRYQIFQQTDGLYAFDTHTGEVYFLKLMKGSFTSDPNKLVWIKLSSTIAEAVSPDRAR